MPKKRVAFWGPQDNLLGMGSRPGSVFSQLPHRPNKDDHLNYVFMEVVSDAPQGLCQAQIYTAAINRGDRTPPACLKSL